MQHRTFDRLARNLGAQPTRRGFLGSVGALVAAGFATTALGQRRDFEAKLADAADDTEEQMVLFFEEIGRLAHEHDGTCDALAVKMRKFEDMHREQIEDMRAEEATWTKDHRLQHATTYGDRREAVVEQVTSAHDRCKAVSGIAASPVAATPAALLPSADLAARVPIGMDGPTVDSWAQDTLECDATGYNFLLESNCVRGESDWRGPVIQWPGWCESWTIDGNCEMCTRNTPGDLSGPEYCAKYWPQDCIRSGENACHVEYHDTHGGVAAAICDADQAKGKVFSDSVRCYSMESGWASREFTWNIYCPDGRIKHNCIDCQTGFDALEGAEACLKYWPDQCLAKSGKNNCYIGFHVTCCDENCPIGTSDCTQNAIDAIVGDWECAGCMLSWCGSESRCQTNCGINDCCDSACGSGYVPPPPGGQGRTGTPVPLGTPNAATPATEVPPPLPPGTPGTEVPPPLPPGTPATQIPTETPTQAPTDPPGTPSASPSV